MRCMMRFGLLAVLCLVPVACSAEGSEYLSSPYSMCEYSGLLVRPFGGNLDITMVTREEGKTTINGQEYDKTVMVYSGLPGMEPQVAYTRLTPDGLLGRFEGSHADEPDRVFLPLPLMVGTKWTSSSGDGKETACSVESKDDLPS